ncbi:glycerate kinase [Acidiferrobacter sp.]|uniref:glycerate kinase n=1 Tax=Acidiferrobacter sp. TaxID=1872107 RepID=UPI0026121224|nr:glycerate kinase [Acidiferrobacter sp.]
MDDTPVVVAPNAFKGTLSPIEAARSMARGVARACPGRAVLLRPMPDGGDGTLEVLASALKADMRFFEVPDSGGRMRLVPFGLIRRRQGPVALIESAQVIGLTGAYGLFAARSTDGLGRLIRHVLDCGARTIYLGLGGSATCDAGTGLLAALGIRFAGLPHPTLENLDQIRGVDITGLDPRLAQTRLVVLTDVVNGLTGPSGAVVFAAQKGADPILLTDIDRRLGVAADHLERAFAIVARGRPGSGAAGGLGFACALLGARLVRGATLIARLTGLSAAIKAAGLVLTGEGACDAQTDYGKGPQLVAAYARRLGRPVYLVCGRIDGAPTGDFTRRVSLPPGRSAAEALSTAVAALLAP